MHPGSNEGWQHPKLFEQGIARIWREGIVPLCSAHVGPHLDTLSSLAPPVQEIHGQTKTGLAEAIEAVGSGVLALCKGAGPGQPGNGTFRGEGGLGWGGGATLAPQYQGEKIELGSAKLCMMG